jgi:hypothetical protein
MIELTTQKELVGFFNGIKSEQRATVVMRTPVKLKKTGNPYQEVFKVQTVVVDLNVSYEQKVNEERMIQNGDTSETFKAQARKWGVHVNGAIIEKEDKFYLSAIEVSKIGTPIYEHNGSTLEHAQIEPFLPSVSASSGKHGLEEAVKYRNYKLDNIIGLSIDGKVRYKAV